MLLDLEIDGEINRFGFSKMIFLLCWNWAEIVDVRIFVALNFNFFTIFYGVGFENE